MPDESGLDLFRSVAFRRPGLSFILMSGNLDPGLRREALGMGICKFVEKPFELGDLKRLIFDSQQCGAGAVIEAPAA
jgi:DNA-binding NtrC family response regulator